MRRDTPQEPQPRGLGQAQPVASPRVALRNRARRIQGEAKRISPCRDAPDAACHRSGQAARLNKKIVYKRERDFLR